MYSGFGRSDARCQSLRAEWSTSGEAGTLEGLVLKEEGAHREQEATPTPGSQCRGVLRLPPSISDGLGCDAHGALRQGAERRYRES